MYSIYKVTNQINNKSYIGFTIECVEKRLNRHVKDVKRGSKIYFHNAIRKYGIENFLITTLKQGEDKEWGLKVEEPYYIGLYKTNYPKWGYNLTDGGEGSLGYQHTDENKKRMSQSHKGQIAWNKGKIGVQASWNKGKTGLQIGPNRGKKFTKEHKERLSESHKGQAPWNKGKKGVQVPWNKGRGVGKCV